MTAGMTRCERDAGGETVLSFGGADEGGAAGERAGPAVTEAGFVMDLAIVGGRVDEVAESLMGS